MKRTVLAAIALSMFAAPMAQAQQRYEAPRHGHHYGQQQKWQDYRHKPTKRQHWSKGKRVPDWQRKQALRDYHRYGLERPGYGQRWVRVNNDFLLISVASGIIASVVTGR